MIRCVLCLTAALLIAACEQSPPTEPADGSTEPVRSVDSFAEDENRVDTWIVELGEEQTTDNLQEVAHRVIASGVTVEPLFADVDPADELGRIFLLRAPAAVSEQVAWTRAYALRDHGGFPNVQPDIEDQAESQREAAAACAVDDGVPAPTDPSWSLRQMKLAEAWALTPHPGGKRFGEGVRICHPDTGWTPHEETDQTRLDMSAAVDLIDSGGTGEDPLGYSGNPGHGTATGSVLTSSGGIATGSGTSPPGLVTGVAPKATLVPIRAIKSVVRFLDSNTARAVNHARQSQCDVVSMSLGGTGFFGLKKVIKRAVREDMIVVAAAGNCVGFMVAPATYDETVAAAATNAEKKPWNGSSRGRAVTISAPGEDVHVARRQKSSDPLDKVDPSDGTSFATANIAGAAALWIAYHGRDRLNAMKGGRTLHELFDFALEQSADDLSGQWDKHRYGYGILDVEKLLTVDLAAFPRGVPRTGAEVDDGLTSLARALDVDRQIAGQLLLGLFGGSDAEAMANRYGPELYRHLVARPDQFAQVRRAAEQRMRGGELRSRAGGLSDTLKEALVR